MIKKFFILAGILSAILLAGCGGGNSSQAPTTEQTNSGPAPAATADACALITKADMEAALGQPVKEPVPKPSAAAANGLVCSYDTVAQNNFGLSKLSVLVMFYPDGAPIEDAGRQSTVKGIGEDAYYSDSGLNVIKGRSWLVIPYLQPTGGPDPKLEELGRKAASRI